jgi:hypothetical protein
LRAAYIPIIFSHRVWGARLPAWIGAADLGQQRNGEAIWDFHDNPIVRGNAIRGIKGKGRCHRLHRPLSLI